MGLILLIVLVLFFAGSFPVFPHSRGWGYRGTGGVGLLLVILLLLLLFTPLPFYGTSYRTVPVGPTVVVPR